MTFIAGGRRPRRLRSAAMSSAVSVVVFCRGKAGAGRAVAVGSRVNKDTVVCIIEAMKVMNEIKAETSGVIKKILVENATAVQFGQPMFLIEKG